MQLAHPRPMDTFVWSRRALVHDQMNDAVYEWPGMAPEEWKRGASWHRLGGKRVLNWEGLLLEAWQPIDRTTPRLTLPP